MITIASGNASIDIDPESGGRVAQIAVDGFELLVPASDRAFGWGMFPMAPFAGRIRHGRFSYMGAEHALPLTLAPHAIHGTLLDRTWTVDGVSDSAAHLSVMLDDPWPYRGTISHHIEVGSDGDAGWLTVRLVVVAVDAMPVTLGWHPWFRRRLDRGRPLALSFAATSMYERDGEGMPTGRLVDPSPGPWDDCFTGLSAAPVLTWPDALVLEFEQMADHLVVYDVPEHAVCVEPQTGPPDAVNLGLAAPLEAGGRLSTECTVRWRTLR
ncbi:MAG: aldose 1-epimerase [Acidimicrobiales bacterium]